MITERELRQIAGKTGLGVGQAEHEYAMLCVLDALGQVASLSDAFRLKVADIFLPEHRAGRFAESQPGDAVSAEGDLIQPVSNCVKPARAFVTSAGANPVGGSP
jgi:hypothetical protein